MGWECPHYVNKKCLKREKPCSPGDEGCVLYGKAHFVSTKADEITRSSEKSLFQDWEKSKD